MGERFTAYVRDEDLFEWMEHKIDSGEFRNRAHAVEAGLRKLRDDLEDAGGYEF